MLVSGMDGGCSEVSLQTNIWESEMINGTMPQASSEDDPLDVRHWMKGGSSAGNP